jgi:hypothetical protein
MDRIEIRTNPAPPTAPNQEVPANGAQLANPMDAAVPAAPAPNANRPGWLPEKFKSPEDLAQAYSELESRFTQANQSQDEFQKAVQATNLTVDDLTPMSREFAETGELSEKSYRALEGKGIPRELVDAYVEGQRALADSQINSVFSAVGGQESYNKMTSWAAENLSPDEIAAFDSLIESGNQASVMMAVRGLHARYSAAAGSPRLIQGGMAASGTTAYRSLAELTAAMRDPRYKSDPAYRKDVEERLRISDVFGSPR